MTWKPGESGNPEGNKKQRRFLAALERAMRSDDGAKLRAAAEKLLDCAAGGEPWAIRELADRLDGKPIPIIDVGDGDGSVAIAIVAYHPAQLPAAPVSAPRLESFGQREEESSSGLAPQSG